MTLRRFSLLVVFAILVGAGSASSSASAASPVRISGVDFDGFLPGSPEPDSAVRLVNTDLHHPAHVGGFVLTEEFTPRKGAASLRPSALDDNPDAHHKRHGRGPRRVRLPDGAVIPAGGEIWVAATATGFRHVFGDNPAYEAEDTDVNVPNASAPAGFLLMPAKHGTVALLDGDGAVVDFVPYELTKEPYFDPEAFSSLPWKGEPVRLKKVSATGWRGQVLARDRDEAGHVVADTDSAADWDSGFSRKELGEDATHRIEVAGQSHFVARREHGGARVLCTSAPDNNFAALIRAIDEAKHEIRVRIYELTNEKIAEALIKAQLRGVKVTLFLEGSPVGGIADQERWLVDRAHKAGVGVWFLATPKHAHEKPRYRFDHSKYVLIDDDKAIVGTENYGRTGVPVVPSYGNRGWMVHIENKAFVKDLRAVWDADFRPGVMPDVLSIDASPTDAYGLPYRDQKFQPDHDIIRGLYADPEKPLLVDEDMGLELVLSPDTSLNEHSAIIGMIERAKKTLYLEENSIRRRWGRKADTSDPDSSVRDDDDNAPNLPLQAVVAAARRGVKVRVMLDSTWYNVQGDDERDNDDTVHWLEELAQKEGLDIDAKVINLQTTHLEKIHAKGIIADDKEVFVGSINWTENSFKGNREVGVVISDEKVAGYYSTLFHRDWVNSRIYGAELIARADVYTVPGGPVLEHLARGDRVSVVGELGSIDKTSRARWAEVTVGKKGRTGFVELNALGVPEATPGEALHVVGREAAITGTVIATNVNDKRIQLRFLDEKRPPFTAIIFKSAEAAFAAKGLSASTAFQGRQVRIRGPVTTWRSPEVVVRGPDMIEIVR